MTRLMKGALLGPVIFALVLFVVLSAIYGQQFIAGGAEGMNLLGLVVAGVLLVANLHVFLLGWPLYRWLQKRNKLNLQNLLVGAFLITSLTGLVISLYLHTKSIDYIIGKSIVYGLFGVVLAWLVWRIGIANTTPRQTKE